VALMAGWYRNRRETAQKEKQYTTIQKHSIYKTEKKYKTKKHKKHIKKV
jgi:hypothetical protein